MGKNDQKPKPEGRKEGKRKRVETDDESGNNDSEKDLMAQISSVISDDASAKRVICHILEGRGRSSHYLIKQILSEGSTGLSFSNVQYRDIAPFVGLIPNKEMDDIPTFELHRSRISTSLFKSIVQDTDIMLLQYGPPKRHVTEEASSRFLSPIFNRLVAEFRFAYTDFPETTIKGSITTQGRIEYYLKVFKSYSIIFIEAKLMIGVGNMQLNAVAQVIAECEGCSLQNEHSVPVYGILCDAGRFQFFLFTGNDKPPHQFKLGTMPRSHQAPQKEFPLDDFVTSGSSEAFLRDLRKICEIVFDILLTGYISGLTLDHDKSSGRSNKEDEDNWKDGAVKSAKEALQQLRLAGDHPKDTNTIVEDTMKKLKQRYGFLT